MARKLKRLCAEAACGADISHRGPQAKWCERCATERDRVSTMMSVRLRRAARRTAGMCTECGERRAAPGRDSCEPCLAKQRTAWAARAAERAAAGLCPHCGLRPPAADLATCEPCREANARSQANWLARQESVT